ncbi:hypothetical protein ACFYNZ_13515 [Streptomyces kebangsaanensis]|uniref:Uncharacterized protein n=1 Tax=Streptomyces kebangsaanensis TaxID=864058 RepID=A0ABW6KV80_9ACTN
MLDPLGFDPYAMWRRALAQVDDVFAPPPTLDRPVRGCTRCTPESELRVLGGDPSAVPDDLLGHFMREVVDHWDADQYPVLWRRLIPRALRAWGTAGQSVDLASVDLALELGRLGRDGARLVDWPAPERTAVEQALRALVAIAVADGRSAGEVAELVEGTAAATGGLEPWLGYIAGLFGPEADAGLVRLAVDWGTDLLWEDFRFSWWYDGDPRTVADWLVTQHGRVEAFAIQHPRCKNAADALVAIARLREGRESAWLYPCALPELIAVLTS